MKNSRSSKPVKLAIFDIDGTIFRSSLIIEVFNSLVQAGVFPKAALARVQRNYRRWLDRKGHYNDYLMTLVHEFYRNVRGKEANVVESVIAQVVREQKDRVYRFTRDLVHGLRRKRYLLLAVSNSPDIMVQPFARSAGLHAAIGRTYETKNGRYTGRITVNGAPLAVDAWMDKVSLIGNLLERRGLRADMAHSIAVGDSEGDVPLLKSVGFPIAFNPSATLADIARRRGWMVIVERKDVMYVIERAGIITASERQRVRVGHQSTTRR
jgi:HAD superfamily hydrolase (TIGR01490 family)